MKHLDCVTSKRNAWYWYLLVLFLSLLSSFLIIVFLLICYVEFLMMLDRLDLSGMNRMAFLSKTVLSMILISFFSFFIPIFILFVKRVHGRTWTQLINGTNRVRWSRLGFGMAVGFILFLPFDLYDVLKETTTITFNFNWRNSFLSPTIALLVVFSMNLVFRGYIAQGIGAWTKSRWYAWLIPTLLYSSLYINGFVKDGFSIIALHLMPLLIYGFITIMDDGLELAIGCGMAKAVIDSTFVRIITDSTFDAHTTFHENTHGVFAGIREALIVGFMAIAIFAYKYKWKFSVLDKKVEINDVIKIIHE